MGVVENSYIGNLNTWINAYRTNLILVENLEYILANSNEHTDVTIGRFGYQSWPSLSKRLHNIRQPALNARAALVIAEILRRKENESLLMRIHRHKYPRMEYA